MVQEPQVTTDYELSILMPCLNEELTIGTCINKAQRFLQDNDIQGEIIIADNGSTDQSSQIAKSLGAKVVSIEQKGYGSALLGGIVAAQGQYIIMGDADDSYNFLELMPFVEKLREGYDLVMGNRFLGGIEPGAMPPLHKYLGNPILSGIGRLFFRTPARDFHCGLRGFSRESVMKLNLQTTGMEFASEMVINASLFNLQICEVPTTLSPDGRDRPPHLRSWRDGWRHLRFMLIFSPRWFFLYPGFAFMIIGLFLSAWTFFSPITIKEISFDIHSLAYFNALFVIGFNMVIFAVQSRYYGYRSGLLPEKPRLGDLYKLFTLERGLLLGGVLILTGIVMAVWAFVIWASVQFGNIEPQSTMRIVIPSVSIIIMGTQVIFSSFFLSFLDVPVSK
jgi:glycosyltransferase involved in cell wall biosynthesis